jgi:hypothetical protein
VRVSRTVQAGRRRMREGRGGRDLVDMENLRKGFGRVYAAGGAHRRTYFRKIFVI